MIRSWCEIRSPHEARSVTSPTRAVRRANDRFRPIADIALNEQTQKMTHGDYDSGLADRRIVAAGATLGGLAVMFGAFGAHALKGRIGADALGWWQTAVEYQMWHALAVLGLGLSEAPSWRLPARLMVGGVLVFSGTLFAIVLGAPRWLGAVTPLGGIAMISGWTLLAWRATRG